MDTLETIATVGTQRRVWRYQRIIRICKLEQNTQRNGQNKKRQHRSTKHTHKTKDRVTRTPLKHEVKPGARGWYAVPASYKTPVVLLICIVKSGKRLVGDGEKRKIRKK